jgi:hypothetical protein
MLYAIAYNRFKTAGLLQFPGIDPLVSCRKPGLYFFDSGVSNDTIRSTLTDIGLTRFEVSIMFLNYFPGLKTAQLAEFPMLDRLHQINEFNTPRPRLASLGCVHRRRASILLRLVNDSRLSLP